MLWSALKDVRVQFWTCPNDEHRMVTWTGDVASCDSCGMTSEMTARLIRAAVAYERERIIGLAGKHDVRYAAERSGTGIPTRWGSFADLIRAHDAEA